ncbi:threonine/serine dehydratase [uncultured Mycolicibacterium sp.]|uniref:threonine ammonia-lyase n=1 Tax=uncultured Mycolicibacterium sp. TaxID=2320817 RepID=UPI0026187D06|nr:threonine/serine dehydratase [uncultured Mycolicibacterium sp.]
MGLVQLEDIRAAAERIRPAALRTPLIPVDWGDPERPLWLKPENLQPVGAFKIRGAYNALARLDAAHRARGVVTHSSGNHAQALAAAAARFGVPAHVVMPEGTPQVKIDATRARGAEVVLCRPAERERTAEELAARTGATLIPPFDHPDVIAGQGTVGLEIVADLPEVACVLVPVSGGGLASGVGVAVKSLRPQATVLGVEPELAADTAAGLAAGHRVGWPVAERNRTIADGLRAQPSELTFAHLQRVLDGMCIVAEDEIRAAVRELATRARLVAEPSGAVPLAAYRRSRTPPGPTVLVISGGNIDPRLLAEILTG